MVEGVFYSEYVRGGGLILDFWGVACRFSFSVCWREGSLRFLFIPSCFAFFLDGLDLTARADRFYFLVFRDAVSEVHILDLEFCVYY